MERKAESMQRNRAGSRLRWVGHAAAVCVLAASLALPGTAFAGSMQLGLRVWDSSQGQGSEDGGQPGATLLGIRVTDSSSSAPLTVRVSFDPCNGSAVSMREVPYNSPASEPGIPVRDGYSFLGWFDAPSGGLLYDFSSPATSDVVLYAQWALRVSCDVPATAVVAIDASGDATGQVLPFVSGSVAPIEVSAVKSARLAGAESVFSDPATLAGVRVTLEPPASAGSAVQVPLETPADGQPACFVIPAKGTLAVSFCLSLPANAKLSFVESSSEICRLSYVIGAAPSS